MTYNLDTHHELTANKISIYASAVIFALSMAAGMATDSVTLLLDAGSWMVGGVITGLLYHQVIKTVDKPPDGKYHFGYTKYEPLVVVVEGLLIVSSCVMAIKYAVQDIIHPEDMSSYGLAIIFTCSTGFAALGIGYYMSRRGEKLRSAILSANATSWYVDAIFAFGMFAGFGTGEYLNSIGQHTAAMYVDPVMSIVLACILVISPALLIRANALELLDASPGDTMGDEIQSMALAFCREYGFSAVKQLRLRKAGRKIFIDISYLSSGTHTITETNKIKRACIDFIHGKYGKADVVVSFETLESDENNQ